jgi:hypothetical protein
MSRSSLTVLDAASYGTVPPSVALSGRDMNRSISTQAA